jgi:hypothetical protein
MSTGSVDAASTASHSAKNGLKLKTSGAAALKPTEIALEQIAGKRRSKFWVYAVEPIPGAQTEPAADSDPAHNGGASSAGDSHMSESNGQNSDMEIDSPPPGPGNGNGREFDRGLDGSLSPLNSA